MKRRWLIIFIILIAVLSSFSISFADVKQVYKDIPASHILNYRCDSTLTYLYESDSDLDQQFTIEIPKAADFKLKSTSLYNRGGYKKLTLLIAVYYGGRVNGNVTISVKDSESINGWSNPISLSERNSIQIEDEYDLPVGSQTNTYYVDIRFTGTLRDLQNMIGSSRHIATQVEEIADGLPILGIKFQDNTQVGYYIDIRKIIGTSFEGDGYWVETSDCTNISSEKEYRIHHGDIVLYEIGDPHNKGVLDSYKLKFSADLNNKYIINHTLWSKPGWYKGTDGGIYSQEYLVDGIPVCEGTYDENDLLRVFVIKKDYRADFRIVDLFNLYALDTHRNVEGGLYLWETDDKGISVVDKSLLYLLK